MRIVIAGIIGGIVLFIWSALAHTALPIGEMGFKLPVEQRSALSILARTATSGPGVYTYPSTAPETMNDADAMSAFRQKYAGSPYAFVVYQPGGNPALTSMTPNLVKQFLFVTLAALLMAWVLSQLSAGFGRRVVVAGSLGLFAWLIVNVPYWNWFVFPLQFTIGAVIEQVVGWLLGGAAIAWWLGRGERARVG